MFGAPSAHSTRRDNLVVVPSEVEIHTLDDSEVDLAINHLGLARLNQGDGDYLVAWIGNTPVGHAYLTGGNPARLQDLEVHPQFRRRGIGKKLVTAVEAEAARRGARLLRLSVSVANLDAQALYRSLGFVDAGIEPRRIDATITIRTGLLEVHDTLLTWEKVLPASDG